MRRFTNLAGAVFALTAVCLLSSCKGGQAPAQVEEPYLIGVVTKSGTSEYWMSIRSGMEAAAKDKGVRILILSPDSEFHEEVQEKMAETLIRRDVDVLAVSPIDSDGKQGYFAMAAEMGIPVISYDTAFEDASVPYIGIDNEKAGYELAALLAEDLEHQGEVGIVTGDLEQLSHYQRMDGFMRYMETEADMKVAFIESGYSNLRMSEKEIKRLRQQFPQVKGIMATSAVTALGIAEGIEEEDVKVVSIDAQEDALAALQKGSITALIAQSGYDIGYETISYIHTSRQKGAMAQNLILDAELLTSQNVDDYLEKKNGITGKQEPR